MSVLKEQMSLKFVQVFFRQTERKGKKKLNNQTYSMKLTHKSEFSGSSRSILHAIHNLNF